MSLFSATARRNKSGDDKRGQEFLEDDGEAFFFNGASLKMFKQYLKNIAPDRHYHFATGGQWHLFELIQFLLRVTGPAKVYMSTWAIMEDAVREYLHMKDSGLITHLYAIFDYKVKEQKTNALLLSENEFTKVTLAKNHSKVTVISNDEWGLTVVGSANQTRNPRIERGVICTCRPVANFDIEWMEAVINNEQPFKVRGK